MWMLLKPRADFVASTRRRAAHDITANGIPRPVEALLAAIGATPHVGRGEDVGIFLHPGRALLTHVSLERLFDQFDCRARDVYASLDEAEAAHRDDVGFLLEVPRAFTDDSGRRRDRGVWFATTVRG
jgi:hypothetical protein